MLLAAYGHQPAIPDSRGVRCAFKIADQLLAGVHTAVACKAITFGQAMDLAVAKVYEVINTSAGNSRRLEKRVPDILDSDHSLGSAVGILSKDLGIVTNNGHGLKIAVPVASMALKLFLMIAAIAGPDLLGVED